MTDAEKLNVLWDNMEVNQVMMRFGRGLDLHDWKLYRSCFLDELYVDFQDLTGAPPTKVSADLWTEFARVALEECKVMHQYTNAQIRLDGDRAEFLLYHVSRHHRSTDRGSSENIQYGWYENELVRTGGAWKIRKLVHKFQWVEGNEGLIDFHRPELAAVAARVFAPH